MFSYFSHYTPAAMRLPLVLVRVRKVDRRGSHREIDKGLRASIDEAMGITIDKPNHLPGGKGGHALVFQQEGSLAAKGDPDLLRCGVHVARLFVAGFHDDTGDRDPIGSRVVRRQQLDGSDSRIGQCSKVSNGQELQSVSSSARSRLTTVRAVQALPCGGLKRLSLS